MRMCLVLSDVLAGSSPLMIALELSAHSVVGSFCANPISARNPRTLRMSLQHSDMAMISLSVDEIAADFHFFERAITGVPHMLRAHPQ